MDANQPLFVADRSARAKLRVSGPQHAWFLHQIVTQAFEDIAPGEVRSSAMLTVHGRMTAFFEAVATEEVILCHAEPELRASLPETLGRYVFATQVEIHDATEDFDLVIVAGDGWREALSGLSDVVVVHATASLGIDAGYAWLRSGSAASVVERIVSMGARVAPEEALEEIRIAHGVPRWGRDMDEKTFPQEAGIDRDAVHYEKGCYLGQEAMAKIHFRGKVNRRLRVLEIGESPVAPGQQVHLGADKVGTVTSVGRGRALAMLRYTIEPETEVVVGDAPARVVA